MHKNIYLFSSSLNYIIFIHLYHFFYHLSLGFDYEFNSLTSTSKLAEAYGSLFRSDRDRFEVVYQALVGYFPILDILPTEQGQRFKNASRVIDEVTTELIID